MDYAVHNGVLNFDVLHNPLLEATLKSGAASGAAIVASTREAIDREEARNGVDYDAAINAATKAYVTAFHATKDAIEVNDGTRTAIGGATYLAVLGKALNAATAAEKAAADVTFAQAANVALYTALVKAAGAVPSMQAVDSGYLNKGWPSYQQDKFDYETVAGRIVFDWQYDDNSMFYAS